MHQRPHYKDVHTCVCTSASVTTNQYLVFALQLTNQVSPATSIFCPLRCPQTNFYCQIPFVAFHSLVRWFSHLAIPSLVYYIPVLVAVNTHYLASQSLFLHSLGEQKIAEKNRRYCRRLVFLHVKDLWMASYLVYTSTKANHGNSGALFVHSLLRTIL